MSVILTVTAILRAASTVTTITDRIVPVAADEEITLPALVLHLSREEDEIILAGAAGYPVADFIVDCTATSFGQANALGDAVKRALTNYRGTANSVQVDYILPAEIDHFDRGDSGRSWRRRLGFRMRYRAS